MIMQPGPKNLITDIEGLLVGNAVDNNIKTGVTVVTAEQPFVASVEVVGGAPGTRETDCLAPHNVVESVDALVLSGGSSFGLDAASGVANWLHEQGRGFKVGPVRVPIVPAGILFDLLNGGDKAWQSNPYAALGRSAIISAAEQFSLGSSGAGFGATTADLKGGLGSASIRMENGISVGALVAVNAHGSAVVHEKKQFWAAPFEVNEEFGGLGFATPDDPLFAPANHKLDAFNARANTTIAIVATDAVLTKAQTKRLAVAAHDGIARALVPSHTQFDGDLVFGLSTREKELPNPIVDLSNLGHAAASCLARAIARGVYMATAEPGDILPCWSQKFGGGNQ